MARQFIYHMQGLSKSYAGGKKVLDNVHLQFYPDAKIGVLGPNGSGKSTLLRIMAGLDTEWNGEAWLADGATRGYLQQEPELDPALNVMGNVMEGVAHKKAILDQYNALMADYNDENAEKAGKLQDVIDSQNLWDRDRVLTQDQMLAILTREIGPLEEVPDRDLRAPASEYRFADGIGRVGFIASVTKPFCLNCNRIRLTSDGKLRYCLFAIDETDVRALLRAPGTDDQIREAVRTCVQAKWLGHEINSQKFVPPPRPMYSIGG